MTVLTAATEERVLSAADVLVGCVTENDPRYLDQAVRLVQSLRWFGGELAAARVLVCAVEGIAAAARRELESHGAEVRVVQRFSSNGSSNRLRFFEEGWDEAPMLFALDCDTLVVRDPLPLVRPGLLQAKIEGQPTVTQDVFGRLFDHFGLPLPPTSHRTGLTGTPTIPYFNCGVVIVPSGLARRLVPVWGKFNRELAERPELAFPCERHLHQASLSLALTACPVPYAEAPVELNYQLNATHLQPAEGFRAVHPAILHYHDRIDPDGLLRSSPYPLARMHSERFNERLRLAASLRVPSATRAATAAPARHLLVLGMHRAGVGLASTVLAGLLGFADPCDGAQLVIFDDALLAALDASWCEVGELDLDALRETRWAALEARARELLGEHAGLRVLADPRLCLLLPFWRPFLDDAVCLLVHRDPLSIARSLQERDGLPIAVGVALWELHLRAALEGSRGLRRLLVSYHDLIAAPCPTVRRLRAELGHLGRDGFRAVDEPALAALIDPALDHHPRQLDEARSYLTAPQLELLAALESGAALAGDPVPPLSAAARETLAAHRQDLAQRRALRAEIDYRDGVIAAAEVNERLRRREAAELQSHLAGALRRSQARAHALDQLLYAVFTSRSWRLGHLPSRLFRRLFRSATHPSAAERWRDLPPD